MVTGELGGGGRGQSRNLNGIQLRLELIKLTMSLPSLTFKLKKGGTSEGSTLCPLIELNSGQSKNLERRIKSYKISFEGGLFLWLFPLHSQD